MGVSGVLRERITFSVSWLPVESFHLVIVVLTSQNDASYVFCFFVLCPELALVCVLVGWNSIGDEQLRPPSCNNPLESCLSFELAFREKTILGKVLRDDFRDPNGLGDPLTFGTGDLKDLLCF
jgi:hypothetical protein